MKIIKKFSHFEALSTKYFRETKKLYVDTSTIPNSGYGLFTKVDFKEGEIICYFTGEMITFKQMEDIEKSSPISRCSYFIDTENKNTDKRILDVFNSNCMARFANDADGSDNDQFINNSLIGINNNKTRVYIYADRDIKAGEEILVSYGEDYWEGYKNLSR